MGPKREKHKTRKRGLGRKKKRVGESAQYRARKALLNSLTYLISISTMMKYFQICCSRMNLMMKSGCLHPVQGTAKNQMCQMLSSQASQALISQALIRGCLLPKTPGWMNTYR